ncbi:hypothetical protein H0H92_014172 [Tricholoma furcatifolium]|nr:hypothetical protein H0H92_014172 [Tricholoma furcatifolium]
MPSPQTTVQDLIREILDSPSSNTPSQLTQANYLFSPGIRCDAKIHQLYGLQEWAAYDIWGWGRKEARVGDSLTIIDPTTSGHYPDTNNSISIRLGALIPHDEWCPYGPAWTSFIAYKRHTKGYLVVHVPRDKVDREDQLTKENDITMRPGITKEIVRLFIEELMTRAFGSTE